MTMSAPPHGQALQIELQPLPPLSTLEPMWRELESRAELSFFLSWTWIGSWLHGVAECGIVTSLLSARRGGRVVGLAVVCEAPLRRLGVPVGRRAYVHETGRHEIDGITIEHNGLLLDRNNACDVQSRMLAHLVAPGSRFTTLHISAMGAGVKLARALPAKVVEKALWLPCWVVDLQQVRERGDYLALLSAKRRGHIRRSQRACEALGPLRITAAGTPAQAQSYLKALQALHAKRRMALGKTSDFCTPFAEAFHGRLVGTGQPRGEVQLLRVQAGEHDLGYVYSFVHQGRVSFYQSGFDYSLIDRRYSPGLVTLVQAIEHNTRLGHAVFDFLAGDMPYKATLATDCEALVTVSLHRDSLLFRLEQRLRSWARQARAQGWLRGSMTLALAAAMSCGATDLREPAVVDDENWPARRLLRPA